MNVEERFNPLILKKTSKNHNFSFLFFDKKNEPLILYSMSNHKVLITLLALIFTLSCLTGCENDKICSDSQDSSFRLRLKAQDRLLVMSKSSEEVPLLTAPDTNEFRIQLLNPGNKILKEWEHYSEIDEPIKIQTGTFTLKAMYGEQHTGAFSLPYFEGTTTFSVRKYEQSEVTVTCNLANVMASVDYTEGFKNSFKDYHVNMASSGEGLIFSKGEKRAAFFEPGKLSVTINLTKADGTSFSFEAAQIDTTKAQQYYRFRFDVDGEAGGLKILVSFDETTIDTPLEIDLSQDWIPGIAPFYTLTGFSNGQSFETLEGESIDSEKYAIITARGRIKSCKLKTTSDLLIQKGWPGKEIDLATIDEPTREKLRELGLKWTERMAGLNMAKVDFTHVFPNLPVGNSDENHSFTLETTDELGQVLERPIVLNIVTSMPAFILEPHNNVWVKTTAMDLNLTMQKGHIDEIHLQYYDNYEQQWETVPHTLINSAANQYTLRTQVNFNAPDAKLKAVYGQSSRYSEIDFQVMNPTFEISTVGLPWATKIQVKAEQTDGDVIYNDAHAEEFKVMVLETGEIQWHEIPFELSKGNPLQFSIEGLRPGAQQSIKIIYDAGIGDKESANTADFTTEEIIQLANFSWDIWDLITNKSINKGGKYKPAFTLTQDKGDLIVYNPASWTTVNSKTVPNAPKTENTWYLVPSTLKGTGHTGTNGALIRNVGWDNYGDIPPENSNIFSSRPNIDPAKIKQRSVGKLFLGEYKCTFKKGTSGIESEDYNYGIPFVSRPLLLKGFYKYLPYNDDKAFIEIIVENRNNGHTTILGSSRLTPGSTNEYTLFEAPVQYTNQTLPATHLRIMFASSDQANESQEIENTRVKTENNTNECIATGSELYIDDIELIYE